MIDIFNMVDMGGIDVVKAQGEVVDGLFLRLLNSIQNCRYSVLCNWLFAEIPIVPTQVELVFDGEKVTINNYISVTPDDVVHIYSIEPRPVLEELSVSENGIYLPETGIDGYNKVDVSVSASLEELSVTENGLYLPSQGVDGFSKVEVEVPLPPLNSFVVSTAAGDYTTGWFSSRRITRVLQSGTLVCGLWCAGEWTCGCYYTLTNYGDKGNVITGDYTAASTVIIDGKTVYLYGGMNGAGSRTNATFNFPAQNKSTTYSYMGVGANYLYGPTSESGGGQYFQGMSDSLKEEFWRLLSLT